jgi:thiol-disulfide isomerase/thioredoxin
MQKLILLGIGFIILFTSCKQNESKDYIILSGIIVNPHSDSITLEDHNFQIVNTFHLSDDNSFNDTIHLPQGFYFLHCGDEYSEIYLKPRFNLNLAINTQEFDESIMYTGNGSSENNYLANKTLSDERFGKLNSIWYYAKLIEPDFLKLADSIHQQRITFLENYKDNLCAEFIYLETKSLEFEKLTKISLFEGMCQYVTGNNEFRVSEDYPDPFTDIDFSNKKLWILPHYIHFIEAYYSKKTHEILKEDSNRDYYSVFLELVTKEIESLELREILTTSIWEESLDYTNEIEYVYSKLIVLISDKNVITKLNSKYEKLKKNVKGTVSPLFELYDIENNLISLSDLKGKIIYIDIWATWCQPCIKEIPYLKKLEDYFEDEEILFVSICKSDKKENWINVVSQKKLKGIQLFAPNEDIEFFNDYSVQLIPRFILLDKELRIIDANAKRPSDPTLREQLESLL